MKMRAGYAKRASSATGNQQRCSTGSAQAHRRFHITHSMAHEGRRK